MPSASASTLGGASRTSCCQVPFRDARTGIPAVRNAITMEAALVGRPGHPSRKHPVRGGVRCCRHIPALAEILPEKRRKRFWDVEPVPGEEQSDLIIGNLNILDPQLGNVSRGLPEE